ncbi:MAG TPA: RsmD family RNA methyltransferase [Polyangiaceae bacterium]|nr:RsmD family RNA methyltransferase [Polyangiaceae bacterium]
MIEKLVPGGAGFCRLPDGRPAFVDGALPGDRVHVETWTAKKGYVEAADFTLDAPGPDRVVPPCPIAEACGGCNWMALSRAAQLRNKAALVVEALERTAGLRVAEPPEVVSVGESLGYRLRVRLHVDERGRVGFFGRRTRALVEVRECLVAAAELREPLAALAALDATERSTLGAHFGAVDLRAVPGGEVELELEPRPDMTPSGAEVDALVRKLGACAHVAVGGGRRAGLRRYELPGGGFLRVPGGGFTQVNWAVNAALVAAVVDGARRRGARSFVDLYAGVGNFSVPLARAGLRGAAVELERTAAAALREALREQELEGVEVITGDVAGTLPRLARKRRGVELALLDPPRSGAKAAVLPLVALAPKCIAYVACDPVTLARDLRAFHDAGFSLVELRCFDMFPETHHVETLAWLETAATSKRAAS